MELQDFNDENRFDDVRSLYIGHFKKVPVTLKINESEQPLVVFMSGEILLHGAVNDNHFMVDQVRRIAFYGSAKDALANRLGIISLTGPVSNEVSIEGGVARYLQLLLHYQALSSELEPFLVEEDAVYPQVERIVAQLQWEQTSPANPKEVALFVSFDMMDVAKVKLGLIQGISLEQTLIKFRLARTGRKPSPPHHSLPTKCDSPPSQMCAPYMETVTRRLPVRFINCSSYSINNVEPICIKQLTKVCEVWRNKGALDLAILSSISNANGNPIDIANPSDYSQMPNNFVSEKWIEVYLIKEFVQVTGGGITLNCGTAAAYIIIALDQIAGNDYLLAHELCHVLGLLHPSETGSGSLLESTPRTIAEPGNPNPKLNSLKNFAVFTATKGGTLNPIVTTTTIPDCFHPDL